MRSSAPHVLRWISQGSLACALLAACGGARGYEAEAALSETRAAQAALRELEERWELAAAPARLELRAPLEAFIEEHGTDPSVARARLLLGRLLLEQDLVAEAERSLAVVLRGPEGRTRDEAAVVQAAIENRRGEAEQALARLAPLEGKLFSLEARDMHARETVRAALTTRRWRHALDAMIGWLALNERRKAETELWVRAALHEIPAPALVRLLSDREAGPAGAPDGVAREWVEREIIALLTREALAKQDARLARNLLENSPIWLRATESGDQLALLASQAEEAARVVGRVVGIVLGGPSLVERRRNIQAVTGLLEGLGLGAGASEIRIVAEEDRGSTATALAALSSQGASLLIAGASAESALVALRFAEVRRVPVVTLTAPEEVPNELSYGFVFGASAREQAAVLEQGLLRAGATRLAFVGDRGVGCESPLTRPGLPTFPLARWAAENIEAFVVLGDASCVARLADETAHWAPRPRLAVGLEAALGPWPAQASLLYLQSGRFPSAERPRTSDRPTPRAPVVAAEWFEVVGSDLARLSRAALGDLPLSPVSDEREVRARHDRVRESLLSVELDFDSTSARGFSGNHVIPHALAAVARDARGGQP